MKKINLSLIASLLCVSSIYASEDYELTLSPNHTYEADIAKEHGIDIVDGWKLSGDIRAGWLEYDYSNPPLEDGSATNPNTNKGHIDSKGIYTTPKISISSPQDNRIKFKATLAGATDFGINDENYEARNFVFDPTQRKSFMLLQEGYLAYQDEVHKILIGREELATPMIDTDDWYMLANSFELGYYENKSIQNFSVSIGYFSKMAGVWDSGANGTEFTSMSQASFIDSADKEHIGSTGVIFGSFLYNDNKHHNLKIWEYYGEDMYNTLFAQYDYTNSISVFNYDIGFQFMNFKEVGYLASDEAVTNIDYSLYSARFDGDFSNGINFATGIAKYTDGEGQGATLGAFGGYPYFANGMIFHFFEAGSLQNAASYKAQLGYDFSEFGVKELWIGYRYTFYDLDSKYSQNTDGELQDSMALNGIRVSYGTSKGTYFTGTYESVDLDNEPSTYSLRLIGGYRF
jgi:hypothetical protein